MRLLRSALVVIAAAGALGYAVLPPASEQFSFEKCGMGPPPDSPRYAEDMARREAEVAKNGFQRVCDAGLKRYDLVSGMKPAAVVVAGLDFPPVALAGTPFATLASRGAMPESVDRVRSRLYRSFRLDDGHTVTLFEHDMSADGSQMSRDPSLEPERINGLPARLVVLQADGGKAVSSLSWREGRRMYDLWVDANVATLAHLRPQLFALAASLPKSVPARPHEPELKPMTIGPDGRPQWPDLPQTITLTEEEMKALRANSR